VTGTVNLELRVRCCKLLKLYRDSNTICGSAACGGAADVINVRDVGDGTCVANVVISGVFRQLNCNTPVFPTSCGAFLGILNIFMGNDARTTAATYVQPTIQKWLDNLGIGSVNTVGGSLSVFVDQTPAPIPVPVAPVFLPTLRQAGGILITECRNCAVQPIAPPTTSVLTALPGLTNVFQVTGQFNFLTVNYTAFTSMSSLAGLTCPPSVIVLGSNSKLTTLAGLDKLATPATGTIFNAAGSGPFTDAASLAAIRVLSGCATSSNPFPGTFVVIPTQCGILDTYAAVCAFNGTSSCPPSPPRYALPDVLWSCRLAGNTLGDFWVLPKIIESISSLHHFRAKIIESISSSEFDLTFMLI
jgi:hypothetical protein